MEITGHLKKGPLLGKELYLATGMETYDLWRECRLTKGVITRIVGKRYLRFDRNVPGFARLSPAIQREFLTYTVVGLEADKKKVEERAEKLGEEIINISREKLLLAKKIAHDVLDKVKLAEDSCFIIGGDVPLNMSHRDPRPERSTGEMVSGSDLDMVVIVSDRLPDDRIRAIDDAVYLKKSTLLKAPLKEEVDYIVKPLSKIKEQARFDSFDKMVACKIIAESKFLSGSQAIYDEILEVMKANGIYGKLRELEVKAQKDRIRAEKYILEKEALSEEEYLQLFSTTEEFSEIF